MYILDCFFIWIFIIFIFFVIVIFGCVWNICLVVFVFGSSFCSRLNFVCWVSMSFSCWSFFCCRFNDVYRINGVYVFYVILVCFRFGSFFSVMFFVYILVIWCFFCVFGCNYKFEVFWWYMFNFFRFFDWSFWICCGVCFFWG